MPLASFSLPLPLFLFYRAAMPLYYVRGVMAFFSSVGKKSPVLGPRTCLITYHFFRYRHQDIFKNTYYSMTDGFSSSA